MSSIRVLLTFLAFSACMQAQQYAFRAYREAEGLKNLDINAQAMDRNGFLWEATENGVYRFIGSGFERYGPEQGISDLNVLALVVDPNGMVWAGTARNLYYWTGRRFVPAGSSPIQLTGWNSVAVEDAGHLLVVYKKRLYRLQHDDQGRMLSFLPVFSISQVAATPALAQVSSVSIVRGPHGEIPAWIGCGKKLCSWVDKDAEGRIQQQAGRVTEWGTELGLADDSWQGVLLDREGTVWAGGRYHVAVLPYQSKRFRDRGIPGSTQGNIYSHAPFAEDREGRVLAPSEDGIARWNGTNWQIIGRANGLQLTGHVVAMAFDAAGDPWLATRGDGLFNWAGYASWEGWNDVDHLPSTVIWSIVSSRDNRILIGTDKGPGWIDPRTGSSDKLSSTAKWTFGQLDTLGFNEDGTIWGGTFSAAVLRIDPRNGKTEQTAKLPAFITRSIGDSSGRLFYTTNEGIYVRPAGDSKAAPRPVEAAAKLLGDSHQVNAGCEDRTGAVWFLTNDRLLRLQNGQWTMPPIDGMRKTQGFMLDIACAADGAVWVTGQQTGVWRLTPVQDRLSAWQLVLPQEMKMLTPVAIVTDRRGWVWLGTDAGLLVWNGREWRHLTQESGLIWNDLNQGAMLVTRDDSIWIGTSGGVAHLLKPEHVFDPVPLNAVVTDIRRGSQTLSAMAKIVLPWSSLPMEFQISSPAMRNRSELMFKYRMEGLQPDWIETHEGKAVFSALPPGNYTFIALACIPALNASSTVVRVSLRILPPWWRSMWFISLSVLALFLFLAIVDRLRAGQLRARSLHLESQVKERTRQLEERISEAKVAEEKIRHLAFYDPLTHLPNRRLLLDRLRHSMTANARNNRSGALLFIDVDDFKTLNDTLGHKIGDLFLQETARRLTNCVREVDTVARLGGDEFVVVLGELSGNRADAAAQARVVAEKILSAICRSQVINGRECFSTSSIGITAFGDREDSIDDLLQQADIAMYQAKAAGRNTLRFFAPSLQVAINTRVAMEDDIRQALRSSQFLLYYQPQLDRGRVTGVEALVRWRHPDRGILAPGAFIPLAEESGLILPLGEWVLETACMQIAAWAHSDEMAHLTIAVNISARQLRQSDFVNRVLNILHRTGANPKNLKLELTESMLVDNIEDVIGKMKRFKAHGIGFSLDDFGTGYSSLSYLKRLPLDQLKIDCSFVRDILEDTSSRAIAQSIISLSQAMSLSVIAEGVETEEQRECLVQLGCHSFQGYLFSRPVPVEEFETLLPMYNAAIVAEPA
jgi:diguanylate cyclase (GGDEF)-like protein